MTILRILSCSIVTVAFSAAIISSCTSGTSGSTSSVDTIAISPATATLGAGEAQTFTALVNGSPSTNVSWSVNQYGGGTIDSWGHYTAPVSSGSFSVIVTSRADSTKSASASVTVTPGSLTALIPAYRITTWNPGIPGGIPTSRATFTTLSAATFGNGVADAQPGINAAIQSAGDAYDASGTIQEVVLGAGAFRIADAIKISRSGVVLRGAGRTQTFVRLDTSDPNQAIQIGIVWPMYTGSYNVTQDALKGTKTLVLDNASAIQTGDVLQIDQVDDSNYINLQPDALYYKRQIYDDVNGPARSGTGGYPGSGWRSEGQQVEIVSKAGNTLTLRDPLHTSFYVPRAPQVFKTATARANEPGVRYSGVEDLWVSGGGAPGNGQPNIFILNAAYCWVRGVEGDGRPDTVIPGTYTNQGGITGIHVQLFHAYRCEVRNSYFHHARVVRNGGIAYGISAAAQSSDNLIEDNILVYLNKPYLGNNSGGGNVIAYNYVDNAYIDNAPGWQETCIDTSHLSFSHMDLFEGNWAANLSTDSTHGTSGFMTFFRNYANGVNSSPPSPDTQNRAAAGIGGYNREHTYVGNVLMAPPVQSGGDPAVYDAPPGSAAELSAVFRAGSASLGGNFEDWDDGTALSLLYRHGNWDSVHNALVWDANNANHNLPASLYLGSKPSFFEEGDVWPWIDPAGGTRVYELPAKRRFDAL